MKRLLDPRFSTRVRGFVFIEGLKGIIRKLPIMMPPWRIKLHGGAFLILHFINHQEGGKEISFTETLPPIPLLGASISIKRKNKFK